MRPLLPLPVGPAQLDFVQNYVQTGLQCAQIGRKSTSAKLSKIRIIGDYADMEKVRDVLKESGREVD